MRSTRRWEGSATCGVQSQMKHSVTCMGMAAKIVDGAYEVTYNGPVAHSLCQASYGYVPDATYSGTEGGCTYSFGMDGFTPWSNTCGYGYRQGSAVCLKNGTEKVDMKFCTANPVAGGSERTPPFSNYEYGYNYSGCDYRWNMGTAKVGACTGGKREVDHPDRTCVRYTQEGMSMGQVDQSFCTKYEKIGSRAVDLRADGHPEADELQGVRAVRQ